MDAHSSPTKDGARINRGPWWWVPSLYFAEGVPYVVVMTVAVIMFKRLGIGNAQIALYTSWLYLPYAIKPLWSPLVQRIGTRRGWIVVIELFVAAGLVSAAMAIPLASFLRWSLVALAATAISSATHDVAADGFYLLALSPHQQAWFVGIRSTAYRMAMIAGQGLLVMLAGMLESSTGLPTAEVTIRASDRAPAAGPFAPQAFNSAEESETQRVVLQRSTYEISVRGRSKAEVDALKKAVRDWNVSNGFYAPPETTAQSEKPDWVLKLESFVRSSFGPTKIERSERSGDVAVVLMRVTRPIPPGGQ